MYTYSDELRKFMHRIRIYYTIYEFNADDEVYLIYSRNVGWHR